MSLQTIQASVPSTTIAATSDQEVGQVTRPGRVSSVTYTPHAAITGAASPNSRTLTLVNKGQDGTGTTNIATLAFTSGVNAAAYDEKAFTLNATATNRDVAYGDVLAFVSTAVTGAGGLVDPGGYVKVDIDTAGITTNVAADGTVTHTQ